MICELEHLHAIVREVGGVPDIEPDEDFYEAGFSSINALQLLMELESAYGVRLPDDRFVEARDVRSLHRLIKSLTKDRS